MDFADLNQALHVVNGDTAAAELKVALQLKHDQVLVNWDRLSCGPAPGTDDQDVWRSTRERYMRELYADPDFPFDEFTDNGLLTNVERLGEEMPVIVWIALGLPDQLLLAWLVYLFDRLGLDVSRIGVVRFERLHPHRPARLVYDVILTMGELRPEDIREHSPKPHPLDPGEADELRRAWAVYTSSDPADLSRFVAEKNWALPLHRAMSQLVHRYPDLRTGMSAWDERLLRNTAEQDLKAARVIAYTMGLAETVDVVGDSYLFRRLIALGSADLVSPLVSVRGNPRAMRWCEVKLTPFGKKILAGHANNVQENGIDDWIGGVHIGAGKPVTYRDGNILVLPG